MKCPHCQADNSEKAKFCKKCGKTLQTEIVCSQCKHRNTSDSEFCEQCGQPLNEAPVKPAESALPLKTTPPTSFASGRHKVKKFLGEGGKKKVYLAHDTTLDRDVAFALIKTEKLDEVAQRVLYARLRPWDVSATTRISLLYTIWGSTKESPTSPPIPGGDVGLIKKAPEHRLPLDKATEIARLVCRGLEFAHSKGIIHRDHGRRRQRIPLLRNSPFGLDKAAGRKEARCKEEYLIGGHNLTNSPKVSRFP